MKIRKLLEERHNTHGAFSENAEITENMYEVLRSGESFERLNTSQRHGLYMMCLKMSRIVSGDPNFEDHWLDAEGYAKRCLEELVPEEELGVVSEKITLKGVTIVGVEDCSDKNELFMEICPIVQGCDMVKACGEVRDYFISPDSSVAGRKYDLTGHMREDVDVYTQDTGDYHFDKCLTIESFRDIQELDPSAGVDEEPLTEL